MDVPGSIDAVNELRFRQTLSKFDHDASCDVEARISSVLFFPSPKFQEFVDVLHNTTTDLAGHMKGQLKLWMEELGKGDDLKSKPWKISAALILVRALEDGEALGALHKLLEVIWGPPTSDFRELRPYDWLTVNLTDRAHLLQKLPHGYVQKHVEFCKAICQSDAADFRRKTYRLFLVEVVKPELPVLSDNVVSWLKCRWQNVVKAKHHDNGPRSIYQLLTDLSMKSLVTEANGCLATEEVVRYLLEMDIYSSSDWASASLSP